MKGISVIICCYNSEKNIVPTLKQLARQKFVPGTTNEIIIVDNNCNDKTVEIAQAAWLTLSNPFSLKIVQQPIPGLSYARELGIKSAQNEYIIFCDDDNWLNDDYSAKVFALFESNVDIGLIGGVGEAVFETAAPTWFVELEGFGYAVGNEGRCTGYVESIYGAGMAIRKSVFLSVTKNTCSFILSDRLGKTILSGGDTELCILVKNAGLKIYLDTSMKFKHYLNDNRIKWRYYLKLRRSFGKASAYLQLYDKAQSNVDSKQKNEKLYQYLSLIKFALKNLKFLLFPLYFKNVYCAEFIQQISKRQTIILENKKIDAVAKLLVMRSKEENFSATSVGN